MANFSILQNSILWSRKSNKTLYKAEKTGRYNSLHQPFLLLSDFPLLPQIRLEDTSSNQHLSPDLIDRSCLLGHACERLESQTIILTGHAVRHKFVGHEFQILIVDPIREHPYVTAHLSFLPYFWWQARGSAPGKRQRCLG